MDNNELGVATLNFPAFVRAVGVASQTPHTVFLGAGASISSGVPSANMCIWQWKRDIFLSRNPGLEDQVRELSQLAVRRKIQHWLDAEGVYPSEDADEEYDFYAQECYPIPEDRRHYFQNLASGTNPALGYQLLCLLAEARIVTSIWTTNFDGLMPKAAASRGITIIEAGLDTADRTARQPRQDEFLHVALHGDFRHDPLKNTVEEVKEQDETLRHKLLRHLEDTTLIVIGYSGRDESIMQTLEEAYSSKGTGRLFWCGYEGSEPPESVRNLINLARANGRQAHYVPAPGFDEIVERLALHCLPEHLQLRVQELRSEASSRSGANFMPFVVQEGTPVGLIKSNAFPIECPSELLQFEWTAISEGKVWRRLRQLTKDKEIVVAPLRGKVLAIGTTDDVKDIFAGEIAGKIERTPIDERELMMTDGVVMSMLTEGLTCALAASRHLQTNGRNKLWLEEYKTHRVHGSTAEYMNRY